MLERFPAIPERTPAEAFRETLPPAYRGLSDEEVVALRDQLYDLAELVLEVALVREEKVNV